MWEKINLSTCFLQSPATVKHLISKSTYWICWMGILQNLTESKLKGNLISLRNPKLMKVEQDLKKLENDLMRIWRSANMMKCGTDETSHSSSKTNALSSSRFLLIIKHAIGWFCSYFKKYRNSHQLVNISFNPKITFLKFIQRSDFVIRDFLRAFIWLAMFLDVFRFNYKVGIYNSTLIPFPVVTLTLILSYISWITMQVPLGKIASIFYRNLIYK